MNMDLSLCIESKINYQCNLLSDADACLLLIEEFWC